MRFGNRNKSNMITMNILIGTDDLGRKLEISEIWSQNWIGLQFLWNLALTANWTCWLWIGIDGFDPKIIGLGKFGTNTEVCSDFYKIWHSQEIKHAYYDYNTSQCLERLHDYRLRTWNYNTSYYSSYYSSMLRMIIGCKIRLSVRTWLIALFNTMLKVIKTWD